MGIFGLLYCKNILAPTMGPKEKPIKKPHGGYTKHDGKRQVEWRKVVGRSDCHDVGHEERAREREGDKSLEIRELKDEEEVGTRTHTNKWRKLGRPWVIREQDPDTYGRRKQFTPKPHYLYSFRRNSGIVITLTPLYWSNYGSIVTTHMEEPDNR